ncbi:MAG TPA: IS4 family transposase [Chthoniobacterales bacterium]
MAAATERRLNTTGEVILAAGRLGGHMNRKGDELPGWQTVWRGMGRLATLVEGYRLGRSRFGE